MTKFKSYSIIYTLSLIMLVGVLAFSVALTCVSSTQNAYADYETDILNNPQAIVNFNQLLKSTVDGSNSGNITRVGSCGFTVNSSLVNGSIFQLENTVLLSGHKYYYFGTSDVFKLVDMNGNTIVDYHINNIYSSSSQITLYYLNYNSAYGSYDIGLTYYFNIIDLTQMFGSGNEPTLQEAQELFAADYYPYSIGTALSNDTFTSYAQGVESVLQNMTTTIDTPTIIRTAQPYYGLYQNSKIVYYSMTGNYPETLLTDTLDFMNSAYVPFMTTLDSNVSLNISAFSIADINIENFILAIYLLSSDNNLILVDTIQSDSIVTNYSLDVVIPTTCEGVVFSVLTEGRTTQYIGLGELKFTYKSNNLTNLLASANESGYNRAKTYYDNYYGEYGSGYQSIYDLGYSAGINAQATDFSNTYYTFPQFLGALFDVPVQVLTSLLDFDVFGFNMKNLVFSLITLAIVFAIVRLILMKTGDGK